MIDYGPFDPPEPEDPCHCGIPVTADCPCCNSRVCTKHLMQAANRLARAIGIPSPTPKPSPCEECGKPIIETKSLNAWVCDNCTTEDIAKYKGEKDA